MKESKIFKIPIKYNNKIDRVVFGKLTHPVIDWGYKNNWTPNFFTTLSFMFQLLSIYYLRTLNPIVFSFFYILGYYFDCVDGPMARKYDMVTVFGDYYDHGTDMICFAIANYYYITVYNLFNHNFILFSYLFMSLGLLKYIGLQEKYYDSKKGDIERSPFLYWTTILIKKNETIKMYRYFSFTVFVIFFSSIPAQIYYFN